jgi:hypothetical protein
MVFSKTKLGYFCLTCLDLWDPYWIFDKHIFWETKKRDNGHTPVK